MPTGCVLDREDWASGRRASAASTTSGWSTTPRWSGILFDGREVLHPAALPGHGRAHDHGRLGLEGAADDRLARRLGGRRRRAIVDDIGLVGISNVVCQVGIAQDAVAAALETDDGGVAAATAEWQRRRDLVLRELAGLPAIPPHGGWSLLVDVGALGFDSGTASGAAVRARPRRGHADGQLGRATTADRYVRLVFANEPCERLEGLGDRVRRALG